MESLILKTTIDSSEIKEAEKLIKRHHELLYELGENIQNMHKLNLKAIAEIKKVDDATTPTTE